MLKTVLAYAAVLLEFEVVVVIASFELEPGSCLAHNLLRHDVDLIKRGIWVSAERDTGAEAKEAKSELLLREDSRRKRSLSHKHASSELVVVIKAVVRVPYGIR